MKKLLFLVIIFIFLSTISIAKNSQRTSIDKESYSDRIEQLENKIDTISKKLLDKDNGQQIPQSEYLTLVFYKDISLIILSIVSIIIAIYSLSTYKRQLRIQTKQDIAKKVLIKVYQIGDRINKVRDVRIDQNELNDVKKIIGRPHEKCDIRSIYFRYPLYNYRLKKLNSDTQKLRLLQFEMTTILGYQYNSVTNDLINKIKELDIAIKKYFSHELIEDFKLNNDELNKTKRICMDLSKEDQPDTFMTEVNACIDKIEETLKPFLIP